MRPHEIFATMPPERAEALLRQLAEKSPEMFRQVVGAAAASMKSRPQYLMKQPFDKRAAAVRRCLSRVAASPVAEEMLAVYFLECRPELLTEWLDQIGLEHEDGILKGDEAPPEPDAAELTKHVGDYRGKDDDPDRDLLLRAFAAQTSIEWPGLEAALAD